MHFYKLGAPSYESEAARRNANPIEARVVFALPAVVCPNCGEWASSERLPVVVPPRLQRDFARRRSVTPAEWARLRIGWSRELGVPAELLAPGARLGPLTVESLVGSRLPPLMHVSPGEVLVRSEIKSRLERSSYSGIDFQKAESLDSGLDLWEMVIAGRAYRHNVSRSSLVVCRVCSRWTYPKPLPALSIDESTWDGSDFLHPDGNPNLIVVSDRVASDMRSMPNVQLTALIENRAQ